MKIKNLLLSLLLVFITSTIAFSQNVKKTVDSDYQVIENDLVSVETKINEMLESGDLVKSTTDTENIIVILDDIQSLLAQDDVDTAMDKSDEVDGVDNTSKGNDTIIADATEDNKSKDMTASATEDTTATQNTNVLPKYYVVKKREPLTDCLWRIAEYSFIYNDPKYWRLIYEANSNIINDANLIYPGQKLEIPSLNNEERSGTYEG